MCFGDVFWSLHKKKIAVATYDFHSLLLIKALRFQKQKSRNAVKIISSEINHLFNVTYGFLKYVILLQFVLVMQLQFVVQQRVHPLPLNGFVIVYNS